MVEKLSGPLVVRPPLVNDHFDHYIQFGVSADVRSCTGGGGGSFQDSFGRKVAPPQAWLWETPTLWVVGGFAPPPMHPSHFNLRHCGFSIGYFPANNLFVVHRLEFPANNCLFFSTKKSAEVSI